MHTTGIWLFKIYCFIAKSHYTCPYTKLSFWLFLINEFTSFFPLDGMHSVIMIVSDKWIHFIFSARWHAFQWEACSKECGGGTKSRRVQCVTIQSGKFTEVSENRCNAARRPSASGSCNTQACQGSGETKAHRYCYVIALCGWVLSEFFRIFFNQ